MKGIYFLSHKIVQILIEIHFWKVEGTEQVLILLPVFLNTKTKTKKKKKKEKKKIIVMHSAFTAEMVI